MNFSRRRVFSQLAAGGLLMPFLASYGGAARAATPTISPTPFSLLVASPFGAEYDAANYLADKIFSPSKASLDETVNPIYPQVIAFDSYAALMKKVNGDDAMSIILPLELFNPRLNFIDKNRLAAMGFRVMEVIKPTPLFLITRDNIKNIDDILQKRTSGANNNILLAELLDGFVGNQFDKKFAELNNDTETTPPEENNQQANNESQDATSDEKKPIIDFADTASFFHYADNFMGSYENDEDLLNQFSMGKIDWFLYMGFFENKMGRKFLRELNAKIFPMPRDSFGDGFGHANGDFITGQITNKKNNAIFSLPLVWLINAPDKVVKSINNKIKQRNSNWFVPRNPADEAKPFPNLTWNGFSFEHLAYHRATLPLTTPPSRTAPITK